MTSTRFFAGNTGVIAVTTRIVAKTVLFETRTGLVKGIYQARPLAVVLERLLLIFGWRDTKALLEVAREVTLAVIAD